MSKFSVCVLLYGEHPTLAKRVLGSLRWDKHVKDYRIGLNSVCRETSDFAHRWANERSAARPVYLFQPKGSRNVGKYPLMRQMFQYGKLADRVMWFDDDSYLDPAVDVAWWDAVELGTRGNVVSGAVHKIMQRGQQHAAIPCQPWYMGKSVGTRHLFRFVTGGWWVGDTDFIMQWDYPFPDLFHNGGDSILGELLRQQGHSVSSLSPRIQCHCEACLKSKKPVEGPVVHINVGGREGRRGIGIHNENYVWSDGNPDPPLSHQNFDLGVYTYAD